MFEALDEIKKDLEMSKEKAINIIIQTLADAYLRRNKEPNMATLLAEKNIKDEDGVIYNAHIVVLQKMIDEELRIVGLNLEEEVNKTGEKFQLGVFSNYENKIMENKLNNVVALLSVVREKTSQPK